MCKIYIYINHAGFICFSDIYVFVDLFRRE